MDALPELQTALSGRYTIERELGRGGMATVYLAHDAKHDRPVALKVLRSDLAAAVGPARFLREVTIVGRLTHPHILPLYDSGQAGESLYYVMPFVDGETLRQRLLRERQLPLAETLAIARQVADALAFAHQHNVVHRDIKPENILLDGDQAYVADFGIARAILVAGSETLSVPGLTAGTPKYMSPEQATGAAEIDGRSDLYSLGCVVYEMLAGDPPHTGPTVQAILARQRSETPRSIRTVRPTVPVEVEAAVLTALAKVPADRFDSVSEFAKELERPTGTHPAGKPAGRPALRLAAIACAILLGLGWLAWTRIRQPASLTPSPAAPTHVAVLYFDDLSEDGTLRPVANGLTEDLIDELGRVAALHVVSPNGVRPFLQQPIPPDSIARALRVGTLVGGSVDRSAGVLRVTVRLIDAASGLQIQSRTLERSSGDLFALQQEIAEEVSRFLRERIGQQIQLQASRAETESIGAWEQTQRAEELRHSARLLNTQGDPNASRRALRDADSLLGLAAAADPSWSKPKLLRGWIARDYIEMYGAGQGDSVKVWAVEGLQEAERVLAAKPGYPPALELRGTLLYEPWKISGLDTAEAETAERDLRAAAVPENPTQARAWGTLSALLQVQGRLAEANLAARKAYEVDAFLADSPQILFRLYHTSIDLERLDDAVNWCSTGRARFPHNWEFAYCELTILLWRGSGPADAHQAWRSVADLERLSTPENRAALLPRWHMMVAGVLARAGLRDSAEAVIRSARAAAPDDPEMDFHEAEARLLLGDREAALELLARDLGAHPRFRSYMRVYPGFRPLWDDPRFQALVGRPARESS